MSHPKEIRLINGTKWHLEDSGLSKTAANALATHLRHTEGKYARVTPNALGFEVWWASK